MEVGEEGQSGEKIKVEGDGNVDWISTMYQKEVEKREKVKKK